MIAPLVILGTSGNALDVLDIVEAINDRRPTWHVAGFLDDARTRGSRYLGLEILGSLNDGPRVACELDRAMFINAIGSDSTYRLRCAIIERCGIPHDRFTTLVHPTAGVSSRASLGRGVCIGYGASVAGNVAIDDHAWVGPGCIIGHDSTLGTYCVLAPGAVVSGLVRVGPSCYVGTGAHVKQRVTLGEASLIGMASVVLTDVTANTVVVGSPARLLKRADAAVPLETPVRGGDSIRAASYRDDGPMARRR